MSRCIRVERVAFAYSDLVPLLADVDLHLAPGFTGLVGENGAGKTTLLRLLARDLAPTAGRITVDPRDALVASCSQEVDACPDDARALADRGDAGAGRWRALLALDPDALARWPSLSPGERRRWQLGGALAREPDVLLLDEPTNHVDAQARALLVGALRRFEGIGIVVSHDRALLDEVTDSTIAVRRRTATMYPGGYSAAKGVWEADDGRARDARATAQRVAKHAAARLVRAREEQRSADANRSASRRKKSIKDHDETAMGRTVVIGWAEARAGRHVEVARRDAERATAAIPDAPAERALGRSIFVDYEPAHRNWLFELAAPEVRAGDAVVLRDVRVAVGPRDRVRIAGKNGAGKTTLLRALLAAGNVPPDRLLALPQELDDSEVDALVTATRQLSPSVRGRVLSLVAALGVDPDRLLASARPSPGEARKLALASGLGRHAWCLVLDEPTNHLDLPSIERLEAALTAFPGAIVMVTHDDALAARVTTSTWPLVDGRVRPPQDTCKMTKTNERPGDGHGNQRR